MAGGKGGSADGDRSIGSRHILGLFFGTVLLCCIFFVLGFVMGRDQSRAGRLETPSKAAGVETATPPGWSVSTPAAGGQAKSVGGASSQNPDAGATGQNGAAPASAAPATSTAKTSPPGKAAAAAKNSTGVGRFEPPLIPRGAIVLQLAALTKDSDALAMAGAIQEKGYPAFVLTPGADNFYRVQVGPYADAKSAEQAKRALENEGFKPIVKR